MIIKQLNTNLSLILTKKDNCSRKKFKNRIKALRIEKGFTQSELAALAKTTQNTISSLETGQYSPTAYLSGLICIALGCKWEDCFYYENVEKGDNE